MKNTMRAGGTAVADERGANRLCESLYESHHCAPYSEAVYPFLELLPSILQKSSTALGSGG